MTHVEDELNSQPECWARVAAAAPEHAGVLPRLGERVALVGCGTSYFMARAAAVLRERAGQGETDAFRGLVEDLKRRYPRQAELKLAE